MIFGKIKNIICEKFEVDEEFITSDTEILGDLEADSLDMADLVSEIEAQFNIKVRNEDLKDLKTIGDIVNYIEENT